MSTRTLARPDILEERVREVRLQEEWIRLPVISVLLSVRLGLELVCRLFSVLEHTCCAVKIEWCIACQDIPIFQAVQRQCSEGQDHTAE